MTDILTAIATAAGVMLPVLIFMLLASITAVRRGEAESHPHHGHEAGEVHQAAPAATRSPPRELSVLEILLLATALFGLAMLTLLGVSMMRHM